MLSINYTMSQTPFIYFITPLPFVPKIHTGASWSWSYGSWIYDYLSNQCLSPLMLWVWISIRAWRTTLCDKVCQWLATDQWFSPSPLNSSTNKILLIVTLNNIKQTNIIQSIAITFHLSVSSVWELFTFQLFRTKLDEGYF